MADPFFKKYKDPFALQPGGMTSPGGDPMSRARSTRGGSGVAPIEEPERGTAETTEPKPKQKWSIGGETFTDVAEYRTVRGALGLEEAPTGGIITEKGKRAIAGFREARAKATPGLLSPAEQAEAAAGRIGEARERFPAGGQRSPEETQVPMENLPGVGEFSHKVKQFFGLAPITPIDPVTGEPFPLAAGVAPIGVAGAPDIPSLVIAGKKVTTALSVPKILKTSLTAWKASMKLVNLAIKEWKKVAVVGYLAHKVSAIPEERIMDIDSELQQMRETITVYPLLVAKGEMSPAEAVSLVDDDIASIQEMTRDFNLYRKLDKRMLTRPKAGDQVMRRLQKLDYFLSTARQDVIILSANPTPASTSRIVDYWTSVEVK